MKKELDWKELGRFFSVVLNLFAVIRDTFSSLGIGLEIIGWFTGEGKTIFVEEFLRPLGAKFLATQRIVVVDDHTIRVNLDAPPMLPFNGAEVETNNGGGWVEVQKRADGLCVDGHRVILYRSERQKGGKIVKGYELRDEVGLSVLHPNILDALIEYSHLIPNEWKKDERGNTLFIFFWGVTFRFSGGNLYVRYLYWVGGRWSWHYSWLDPVFNDSNPAALLAS